MHVCRPTIGRVHLFRFSKKKNQSSNQRREYWYGRPESLQTQTLAETQEKGHQTNLKHPKSIPKNLIYIPQYGRQLCCGWENPLWTSTTGSIMHAKMTL
jgi:hypothetical protein